MRFLFKVRGYLLGEFDFSLVMVCIFYVHGKNLNAYICFEYEDKNDIKMLSEKSTYFCVSLDWKRRSETFTSVF